MDLPFTSEEFLRVFASYNNAVFPAQIFFNLFALFIIYSSINKRKYTDLFISLYLGFLWLWIGIVYQILFFSKINPAAILFAVLFTMQGLIFVYFGGFKKKLSFTFRKDWIGIIGLILISYALVIYPLLGLFLGHTYPYSPTFGLPCPTAIFTFGLLLWTDRKVSVYFLIIPIIWSVIGFFAAIALGISEDIGLLISGILALIILTRDYNKKII